jgi:hypothetical protein
MGSYFDMPKTNTTDLVICLTVMNYIYAISTKKLEQHDVICASTEVYDCVNQINHSGLRNCTIYDLQKFTSLRHALKFKRLSPFNSNNYFKYSKVYLSFPDGWHFAHLSDYINLTFEKIILLDDGIGNLTEKISRFHNIKNLIAALVYGNRKIFSPGRNFDHHRVQQIATIYTDLLSEQQKNGIVVNDVREAIGEYLGIFSKKFLPSGYNNLGIYVQSDHGAYHKDQNKLLRYLDYNLKYLEDKSGMPWYVKSKGTDPLRHFYARQGINLLETTVNLELILDRRVKAVCTRFDTFALNSMIFNIDVERYVRSDPSKNASVEKVELVTQQAKKMGYELNNMPGLLDDH